MRKLYNRHKSGDILYMSDVYMSNSIQQATEPGENIKKIKVAITLMQNRWLQA